MKFFLLGYMASGKSTIGENIAAKFKLNFIDLDHYIEKKEGILISEIFNNFGELKFRKLERFYLEEILKLDESLVVSLGGGTPCYYDSIDLINNTENTVTIYLRTSLDILTERLILEKDNRPLISDFNKDELKEFIGKHLFERSYYYNKANIILENTTLENAFKNIKDYLVSGEK